MMIRGYSPIVLLGMGLNVVRQAAMAALIVVLSYVTMQNWGPDLAPVESYVMEQLRQIVTG